MIQVCSNDPVVVNYKQYHLSVLSVLFSCMNYIIKSDRAIDLSA